MFYSPCLLHLYHPLASLGAQCHQRTQGTRIISSVLGTGMKFGLVSVSTCWLFCHSCGTHVCIAAYPLQTACPEGGWHSGGLLRDRGTVPKQQKWFMDEGPCPAHPEEQVIARDCSFCLSLLSKVVGMNRQCQTALCLLCRQCLTVNNTEDLADFLSITGCASVLAQTRKGLVQQKFGGHFLISLNWNSGTSRLGLVLLLGNTYIELPLFQPDTRLQCNLYYL